MRMKLLLLIPMVLWCCSGSASVALWAEKFDNIYYQKGANPTSYSDFWINRSKAGSSSNFYTCSEGIDALTAMYLATGDAKYIGDAVTLCKNITGSSVSVKGNYKGWTSKEASGNYRQVLGQEVPLYESYLFRYMARLLYEIKTHPALFNAYKNDYASLLSFVETNGWQKWKSRGKGGSIGANSMLMRSRTHMSAHWALTALFLGKITVNSGIKSECDAFVSEFNRRMRSNLRNNPVNPLAYAWNATWDDETPASRRIVQDISHGNNVIAYIVEAYGFNTYWTKVDINKFAAVITNVSYNRTTNTFATNVDRTSNSAVNGQYQADGWVKLGRYNKDVYDLFARYAQNESALKKNYQQGQFLANMALNAKILGQ